MARAPFFTPTFDPGGEDLADQYPRDGAEARGERDDERAQRHQRHARDDGGRLHVVAVRLGAEKAADDERAGAGRDRRAQQQRPPALSVDRAHGRARGRHGDRAHRDRRRVRSHPAAGLLRGGFGVELLATSVKIP